jgi:hypothetical protein
LATRSESPSLQISQRTSVECGNAETCEINACVGESSTEVFA